jgi:hypothetical protein
MANGDTNMTAPSRNGTALDGVKFSHAGDDTYIMYNITADDPSTLGIRTIWALSQIEKRGYVHMTWIHESTKELQGIARKAEREPEFFQHP